MEGYLTHRNITLFLLQQRALVVAFLRALLPNFLIINYRMWRSYEFWTNINGYGDSF